ncbi:hypothetical protein UP09_31020 [Bradyrhizobium sp. LTSP885]|uniref:hypothetical protein n=1 Tax=Bradyrhizobium sp. LTSP885 TaxID=1619232 RepID=UPI0005CA7645|nr:hypothetical protein [Bradyrhizobium sp. LTSP885]KJC35658.1 hypothetical protein UP09_31020 [Bradyrhizobium sp. LTSP885]
MNSIVALPIIAAVPTIAPAIPPEADPIFGAIDGYRQALAACVPVDGDIPDALSDRLCNASRAVMRTRPVSPAGLAALTGWMRERADDMRDCSTWHSEDLCALAATIDDATRGMSGLKAWSPAAGRNEERSDPTFALIEEHRAAEIAFKEAVHVEFGYEKSGPEVDKMKPRSRGVYEREFEQLQASTEDAGDRMCDLVQQLVTTSPTTLAGTVALCTYLEPMFNDMEGSNLPDEVTVGDDEVGPQGAFAGTVAQSIKNILNRRTA